MSGEAVETMAPEYPSDPPPAVLPETSVFWLPPWLEPRYREIVVISHRRHLDGLDLAATDRLIVSTDWMAWRHAVDAGRHCIHFEAMLDTWPAERGDPENHHRAVCEWVYDGSGRDMTLFEGVSLGKQFVRDATLFCSAYSRVRQALAAAVGRFRPDRITLVDLRVEHDLLDQGIAMD
ncbi:MAG: hypothetical protein VW835_22195, partial [Rickettsiales bacterium]